MTQSGIGTSYVWFLIVVLGIGTYGLRLSFLHVQHSLDELPPRLERGLDFVPAAILAALVCSELVTLEGLATGAAVNARLIAAGLAFAVGLRTRSIPATIGVGMAALWTFLWW